MPGQPLFLATQPKVKIAGSELRETEVSLLFRSEVDLSLSLPGSCELSFLLDTTPDNPDPVGSLLDATGVAIAKPLELSASDVTDSTATSTPLFKGEIVAVEGQFDDRFGATLVVSAYDVSHRLHRSRKTRVFRQMKDSDIARKLISEAGASAGTIDASSETHDQLLQADEPDWDFLQARALAIGYSLFVDDAKVCFRKASSDQGSGPTLKWGENLIEFRPRVTAAEQVPKVTVNGWDPVKKQAVKGSASTKSNNVQLSEGPPKLAGAFNAKEMVMADGSVRHDSTASTLAASLADLVSDVHAEADGTCMGDPSLLAGRTVTLQNLGKTFDGKYEIARARHVFDQGDGYRTHFEAHGRQDRSLLGLVGDGTPGTGTRTIPGLVLAIVTDVADPDDMGHVQVKFPWLDDQATMWARMAHPGAGKSRGFHVLPEIDDEVIVSFDHGDVNAPYVLGGLYNGKDKPKEGKQAKYLSGGKVIRREWVSRTGHRIVLEDPPGSGADGQIEIAFSDDTTSAVLTKDKVTIKCDGTEIVLEKTKATLKTQNMSLEATGDLKLSGQTVSIEAKAKLDLKSNGPASVKGTPIQLN